MAFIISLVHEEKWLLPVLASICFCNIRCDVPDLRCANVWFLFTTYSRQGILGVGQSEGERDRGAYRKWEERE